MSTRPPKRTRWTLADARAILTRWKATGLSLRKFAEQEGVPVQRLERWRQMLGKAPDKGFVEVPLLQSPPSAPVEVVLKRGVVVRLSESTSIPLVVELISALEQHRAC